LKRTGSNRKGKKLTCLTMSISTILSRQKSERVRIFSWKRKRTKRKKERELEERDGEGDKV